MPITVSRRMVARPSPDTTTVGASEGDAPGFYLAELNIYAEFGSTTICGPSSERFSGQISSPAEFAGVAVFSRSA